MCRGCSGAGVRESGVEDRQRALDQPEDHGVQVPACDLDLGPHDAGVVFLRVGIERGARLGRHVAVGEAVITGADKVGQGHFDCEDCLMRR